MLTDVRRLATMGCAIVIVAACGAGASPAPSLSGPSAAATPAAVTASPSNGQASKTPTKPSGVIAMGHSGLTGEGTGGAGAAPENSWATGTNPDVKSVYLRLKAVRPDLAGDAANTAHGGAAAAELDGMAASALEAIPRPALAILQSIDSDIHCDGSDADHVKDFGQSIDATLKRITTGSPDTRILVVGQLGRPSVAFVQELVAHDPSVVPTLTGTGICDFLDASGKPIKEHFATLTGIIDAYEREEARVCAQFSQCATDGGVRAAYKDAIANFSPDYNHLNIRGQAAEAELIWPVVSKLLGLPG